MQLYSSYLTYPDEGRLRRRRRDDFSFAVKYVHPELIDNGNYLWEGRSGLGMEAPAGHHQHLVNRLGAFFVGARKTLVVPECLELPLWSELIGSSVQPGVFAIRKHFEKSHAIWPDIRSWWKVASIKAFRGVPETRRSMKGRNGRTICSRGQNDRYYK